jgi:A/G-specific adenine glycosylase
LTASTRAALLLPRPEGDLARLVDAIREWWAGARRARDRLPWRERHDPWEVLVAETMLAQTQVGRVAARYDEFVGRFPTPEACAMAPIGEVVRAWAGLGYNRRALTLHSAAVTIVRWHDGSVPQTFTALIALPGVGPYTARAVQAFAFMADVAVVDTNVGRVLARAGAGRQLRASEAQALADGLVPAGHAREWNLALMDFGSLVCSSRRPACDGCPVHAAFACAWRSRQARAPDPAAGSARVTSRRTAFEGSDRQGRGRLVRAACSGPIASRDLARIAGWPSDVARARRVVEALVGEGIFVRLPAGDFTLP